MRNISYNKSMDDWELEYPGLLMFRDSVNNKKDDFFGKITESSIKLGCDYMELIAAIYHFSQSNDIPDMIDKKFPNSKFGVILKTFGFGIKSIVKALTKALEMKSHKNVVDAIITPDASISDVINLPDELKDTQGKLTSTGLAYLKNMKDSSERKIDLLEKLSNMQKPEFGIDEEEHEMTIEELLNTDVFELAKKI